MVISFRLVRLDRPKHRWQAAKDACEAIGTRLCTSNELSLFDAKQGCTIDHLRVWTSTRCEPSRSSVGTYAVNQAASSNYLAEVGTMCEMEERQQNVRCCADSHGKSTPAILVSSSSSSSSSLSSPLSFNGSSSLSCAALGWDLLPVSPYSSEPRNSTACMEPCEQANHTNCDPSEDNCTIVTFNEAVTHCSQLGARLCGVGELDSSRLSNCLSRGQVWTRSNCQGGVYVVGDSGVECVPATRRYWPMCCADAKDNNATSNNDTTRNAVVASQSCASLGWQALGSSSCITDKVVEGACRMNVDFLRSQSMCNDLGARLCNSSEIRTGFALLNGCFLSNTRF